jgi:hypothetical protein
VWFPDGVIAVILSRWRRSLPGIHSASTPKLFIFPTKVVEILDSGVDPELGGKLLVPAEMQKNPQNQLRFAMKPLLAGKFWDSGLGPRRWT